MFDRTYIILKNGKKIRVKDLSLEDSTGKITFTVKLKYYAYFNSEETSLQEGFFKGLFYESIHFIFDQDSIPTYEVKLNEKVVHISATIEEN